MFDILSASSGLSLFSISAFASSVKLLEEYSFSLNVKFSSLEDKL